MVSETTNQPKESDQKKEILVLTSPQWLSVFVGIAIIVSFIPLFAGYLLGFSVAHDSVFGTYALISGGVAHYIIRLKIGIKQLNRLSRERGSLLVTICCFHSFTCILVMRIIR